MKVLVCINNNLCYDTRVKRHVSAIAEKADSVHVLAEARPDDTFWLDLPNVTHSFVNIIRGEHPVTSTLRELCEKLDILSEVQEAAPVLYSDTYFCDDEIKRLLDLQNRIFSSDRWADVRAGVPEECADVQQIASWVYILQTMIKWADAAADIDADVIYCNDTVTLLCGVAHKKKYSSRLIYDVHDIFYDPAPGEFCRAYRYYTAMIENQGIQYADAVVGVGNQVLNTVKKLHGYNGPMLFIPNCTPPQSKPWNPQVKKETTEPLRFYYHGIVGPVRGIEKIILALHRVKDAVLVLRCVPSPYVENLQELVKEESLCERVKFLDAVPVEDILNAAAKDADVGLAFWDNRGQARLSLAIRGLLNNKFIEYLTAGIPVLTLSGTEQGDIVQKYQCGAVGECTVEDIAEKMNWFCENRAQYAQMSQNALRAASELFVWDKYKPILQQVVCTTESSAPNDPPKEESYLREEKRLWQGLYYSIVAEHEQQCQQSEQRNRELEQRCQQLELRYQDLLNSKSWKLTAPLRSLNGFIKGRTEK